LPIQTRLGNARAVLSTRESTRGRTLIFFLCTGFLKGDGRCWEREFCEKVVVVIVMVLGLLAIGSAVCGTLAR